MSKYKYTELNYSLINELTRRGDGVNIGKLVWCEFVQKNTLSGWLDGWMVGWLVSWLVGWLVDRLA